MKPLSTVCVQHNGGEWIPKVDSWGEWIPSSSDGILRWGCEWRRYLLMFPQRKRFANRNVACQREMLPSSLPAVLVFFLQGGVLFFLHLLWNEYRRAFKKLSAAILVWSGSDHFYHLRIPPPYSVECVDETSGKFLSLSSLPSVIWGQ